MVREQTAPRLGHGRTNRWRCELFVLRGEDRDALRRQVARLQERLSGDDDLSLAELACSLNASLPPGGERLAVVAASAAELAARLQRADEKLADAKCRQINDTRGIYYTAEPLYPAGRIGLLFPGEGAQYPDMLADLVAEFSEAAEHFRFCDGISTSSGRRSTPISHSIFLPEDATDSQREAAERELARLDNAVSSVLIADWAVYRVLWRLGLRGDVAAGHSSGEFCSLVAGGCVEADEELISNLFALSRVLRKEEDAGHMADAALLAAGTGRSTVAAVIDQLAGEAYVAMDNCPHQTIVGGSESAVAAVEQRLKTAGVVCQRLPFKRAYHTPLFRPHLDSIEATYRALRIEPPRMPVYCCVTGRPFPADAAEIRRLAVSHWAATVEFSRLIESMYDDGVRLFVEVGPRGNLTSFVQDILRGREFVAVAADIQHQSSLSQLNHLAGQLAVHHVPLRLEYLYDHDPGTVPTFPQGKWDCPPRTPESHLSAAPQPSREAILRRHFEVMEGFLKVQEDVHRRYFAAAAGRACKGDSPIFPAGELGQPPNCSPAAPEVPASVDRQEAVRGRVMIGRIMRHEPGRSLLIRRDVDLNEDLYARDHTLGGRDASTVDPQHHGLAVMPMALNLEMMAEVASLLVPGRPVIGMRRVRLQRWIPLYEEPITLEVSAEVEPSGNEVKLEIRDLGNQIWPGNSESPAVEGRVLFGDQYPDPPEIDDFPLTGEGPCRMGHDELYKTECRMFHGPSFQAVESTQRMGEEGIEGTLTTLSHAGLFASTERPNLLLDPLLIDASTHILGAWHLSLPDRSGRVVFPYELGSVEIFAGPPAEGTKLKCRVAIEQSSARQVSHRIDLIGPDGKLWCRLHPAEYWRFYWPPECVDFFRHHDEFLLGREWPDALRDDSACCMRVDPSGDIVQPTIRSALARVALSRDEWQSFCTLQGPDRRRTEWLFGRIAAKDCVRRLWETRHGRRLFPADLQIDADAHGRPVVRARFDTSEPLPEISIAHSEGTIVALAAFDRRVGIDLERIKPRERRFEEIAFDPDERELLDAFGTDRDQGIARFWCAKEAVSKALGRGLIEGPRSLAVREFDRETGRTGVELGVKLGSLFPELESSRLEAWTNREQDIIVATTFVELPREGGG